MFAFGEVFLKLGCSIESSYRPEMKKWIVEDMKKALKYDDELIAKLTPDYEPCCKRVIPHPKYLDIFHQENVKLVRRIWLNCPGRDVELLP